MKFEEEIRNNKNVILVGPDEIVNIIQSQIAFFQEKEKRVPNCLMMGISIITILDGAGKFNKNPTTGDLQYGTLKVYLDGENESAICTGYTPFMDLQKQILI